MKNFVEQISIKFRDLYLIKMNLVQLCLIDKHTKISAKISVEIRISADIQKTKYRPIILVDRYIGRFLVSISFLWRWSRASAEKFPGGGEATEKQGLKIVPLKGR